MFPSSLHGRYGIECGHKKGNFGIPLFIDAELLGCKVIKIPNIDQLDEKEVLPIWG